MPEFVPNSWIRADLESEYGSKVTLTPASADALEEGAIPDPRTPGLSIEVGANGRKVWRYRRRITFTDTVLKLTLGRHPQHSIADAREWASRLNTQAELGPGSPGGYPRSRFASRTRVG